MKLGFLYAGQGSQHPGMGADLYERFPTFRAVLDSAAARVDFDLKEVSFIDAKGVLNQTRYTQPCMVAFAAGMTALLAERGIVPAAAAGLSLGEYSALHAAGDADDSGLRVGVDHAALEAPGLDLQNGLGAGRQLVVRRGDKGVLGHEAGQFGLPQHLGFDAVIAQLEGIARQYPALVDKTTEASLLNLNLDDLECTRVKEALRGGIQKK